MVDGSVMGYGRYEGFLKILAFDVFGTVVDWYGSIAREVQRLGRARYLPRGRAQTDHFYKSEPRHGSASQFAWAPSPYWSHFKDCDRLTVHLIVVVDRVLDPWVSTLGPWIRPSAGAFRAAAGSHLISLRKASPLLRDRISVHTLEMSKPPLDFILKTLSHRQENP